MDRAVRRARVVGVFEDRVRRIRRAGEWIRIAQRRSKGRGALIASDLIRRAERKRGEVARKWGSGLLTACIRRVQFHQKRSGDRFPTPRQHHGVRQQIVRGEASEVVAVGDATGCAKLGLERHGAVDFTPKQDILPGADEGVVPHRPPEETRTVRRRKESPARHRHNAKGRGKRREGNAAPARPRLQPPVGKRREVAENVRPKREVPVGCAHADASRGHTVHEPVSRDNSALRRGEVGRFAAPHGVQRKRRGLGIGEWGSGLLSACKRSARRWQHYSKPKFGS